jgi:hypothetical protein
LPISTKSSSVTAATIVTIARTAITPIARFMSLIIGIFASLPEVPHLILVRLREGLVRLREGDVRDDYVIAGRSQPGARLDDEEAAS